MTKMDLIINIIKSKCGDFNYSVLENEKEYSTITINLEIGPRIFDQKLWDIGIKLSEIFKTIRKILPIEFIDYYYREYGIDIIINDKEGDYF